MNASAAMRMPNATWSAISSGGSNATSRCSSGGGVRGSTGRESRPRREVVQADAALAEALAHAVGRHRRELAERLHAEPGEQSDEIGRAGAGSQRRAGAERRRLEHRDRQRREEPGRPAGGHDEDRVARGGGRLRRLLGGEGSVGDPRPHPVEPGLAQHAEQHARRLGLSAVVARRTARPQRAEPRPHHLHARGVLLDPRHDRGERAVIARRVGRNDLQPRAARLRIASALPAAHALGAGGRRARRDEVVLHHGDGQRGIERGRAVAGQRGDRPVREPQHEAARRRLARPSQPTALAAPGRPRRRESPAGRRRPRARRSPRPCLAARPRARRTHRAAAVAPAAVAASGGSTT